MKEKILDEFINSGLKIRDINKLKQYIDLCLLNNQEYIKYETAKHHILPKSIFPLFKNFNEYKWNKSILSHENHFLAHSLLALSVDNYKIECAWWYMSGLNKNKKVISSEEFAYLQEKRSRGLSKLNSTRKPTILTEEAKKKISASVSKIVQGKDNPRALEIEIFNSEGILQFKTHGNFKEICILNNLPFKKLKFSYQNNGERIYNRPNHHSRITEKYKIYIGWYARKVLR